MGSKRGSRVAALMALRTISPAMPGWVGWVVPMQPRKRAVRQMKRHEHPGPALFQAGQGSGLDHHAVAHVTLHGLPRESHQRDPGAACRSSWLMTGLLPARRRPLGGACAAAGRSADAGVSSTSPTR